MFLVNTVEFYLKVRPLKIYPKLKHYVDYLTLQRNHVLDRYPDASGEAQGMNILETILGNAGIPEIRHIEDPYDRYEDAVLPIVSSLSRAIDATYGGTIPKNCFIASEGCVEELLVVSPFDAYASYPLGQGWEAWSQYRCLQMIDCDTDELSLSAINDKLSYGHKGPDRVVFSLDCSALILQYCCYLDSTDQDAVITIQDYLHRYVIYPCLIKDSMTLWLIKQYQKIIAGSDAERLTVDYVTPITADVKSIALYRTAMRDVRQLVRDVQAGVVYPVTALNSLILFDDTSVVSHFNMINADIDISPFRQTRWALYLRDRLCLDVVFGMARLNKSMPQWSYTKLYTERAVKLLQKSRFWNSVAGESRSHLIESGLNQVLSYMA